MAKLSDWDKPKTVWISRCVALLAASITQNNSPSTSSVKEQQVVATAIRFEKYIIHDLFDEVDNENEE